MIRILERVRERLSLVLFALALALLLMSYGYLVGTQKLFPYSVVARAEWAMRELWRWAELYLPFRGPEDHPHVILWTGPEPQPSQRSSDTEALTFIEAYRPGGYGAVLVDANGKIRHEWRIPDEVHERLRRKQWRVPDSHHEIMGSHLFENGDVVFNINLKALVRIDRCSNMLWYLDKNAHHSVFVDAEGFLWVPGRRLIREKRKSLPRVKVPFWEDSIMKISPDGEVLEEISVLESIFASGYDGLVLQGEHSEPTTTSSDPLHLNDVELVSAAFASHYAFLQAGDILVSMRTIDAIAVIDKDTHRVKYASSGQFLRQHDPDALDNGNILLFDNRTGTGQLNQARFLAEGDVFGYSRVIELNPKTQEIVWSFEGSDEAPFYSSVQGSEEQLDNGNVLIIEPEGGQVFEVDRASKEIVWQFRNKIGETDKGTLLGRVTGAARHRASDLSFLDESCD